MGGKSKLVLLQRKGHFTRNKGRLSKKLLKRYKKRFLTKGGVQRARGKVKLI